MSCFKENQLYLYNYCARGPCKFNAVVVRPRIILSPEVTGANESLSRGGNGDRCRVKNKLFLFIF